MTIVLPSRLALDNKPDTPPEWVRPNAAVAEAIIPQTNEEPDCRGNPRNYRGPTPLDALMARVPVAVTKNNGKSTNTNSSSRITSPLLMSPAPTKIGPCPTKKMALGTPTP